MQSSSKGDTPRSVRANVIEAWGKAIEDPDADTLASWLDHPFGLHSADSYPMDLPKGERHLVERTGADGFDPVFARLAELRLGIGGV